MTEPGNEAGKPPHENGYQQHLDDRLDEALKETFPASDPIAVTLRRREAPPRPHSTSRRPTMTKDVFPRTTPQLASLRKELAPETHEAFTKFSQE